MNYKGVQYRFHPYDGGVPHFGGGPRFPEFFIYKAAEVSQKKIVLEKIGVVYRQQRYWVFKTYDECQNKTELDAREQVRRSSDYLDDGARALVDHLATL